MGLAGDMATISTTVAFCPHKRLKPACPECTPSTKRRAAARHDEA